jgi:hypothetical protein
MILKRAGFLLWNTLGLVPHSLEFHGLFPYFRGKKHVVLPLRTGSPPY